MLQVTRILSVSVILLIDNLHVEAEFHFCTSHADLYSSPYFRYVFGISDIISSIQLHTLMLLGFWLTALISKIVQALPQVSLLHQHHRPPMMLRMFTLHKPLLNPNPQFHTLKARHSIDMSQFGSRTRTMTWQLVIVRFTLSCLLKYLMSELANFQYFAKKGITLSNNLAVTHPSEPNYMAAVGGYGPSSKFSKAGISNFLIVIILD